MVQPRILPPDQGFTTVTRGVLHAKFGMVAKLGVFRSRHQLRPLAKAPLQPPGGRCPSRLTCVETTSNTFRARP